MAVHRFQTADGKTHRIEAPSREAAEAELRRVTKPRTAGDNAFGLGAVFNRSIPFFDEGGAAMAAGLDTAGDVVSGRPANYGKRFQQRMTKGRKAAEDFQREHPTAANLTKGLGLSVQMLPALMTGGASATPTLAAAAPHGLMGSTLRTLKPVADGAVVGGLSGQVAAYGGDGTLSEREQIAKDTAGTSIALGAAAPLVLKGASLARRGAVDATRSSGRVLARTANRVSGGRILNPQDEAGRRLGEALKADGLGPQEVRAALQEWQATGASSPALMDLAGENTRALLRSAGSKPGPARNLAVGYADKVAGDLQGNAIARTRDLTPDRRSVSEVGDEIRRFRSSSARVDYPAFADKPVPVGDDIVSAADGASRWMQQAHDLAVVERNFDVADEIKRLADAAAGGGPPPQNMTAGALDYVRRTMRDAADEAFRGGRGEMARALGDRSRDIESALMDVPGFDQARTVYRGFSQQLDALDEGAAVMNQVPDDFAATFRKLPVEQGGIGARQAIEEAIGRPTEGATGTLNRLATSTNSRRNLGTLFGEDEAARYQAAIGREVDRLQNARFISPNTGSQSAPRLVDDALVEMPPMTKVGIVKTLYDKLRRGVTLTDGERQALLELGTTIVRTGDDIPRIPTTPQAMRLLTPAQRQRLSRYLAAGEGAVAAQEER